MFSVGDIWQMQIQGVRRERGAKSLISQVNIVMQGPMFWAGTQEDNGTSTREARGVPHPFRAPISLTRSRFIYHNGSYAT